MVLGYSVKTVNGISMDGTMFDRVDGTVNSENDALENIEMAGFIFEPYKCFTYPF